MIISFGDRATEALYHTRRPPKRFPSDLVAPALRKLDMLNAATNLTDLRVPPGNRLEALQGRRSGRHSIRINDQWRVVFRWEDGDACEVHVVDDH